MAFELPDGKTARTLPEQVKFLTEKLKDLYTAFNELGIKKVEIVESLPEVGQEGVLYMVPVEDPDTDNYYEEYIWLDSQWEMIGTTHIDLSGYVTTNTEQIITAAKTIENLLKIKATDTTDTNRLALTNQSGNTWTLNANQYGSLRVAYGGTEAAQSAKYSFSSTVFSGNGLDLGDSTQKWKDFYLSGVADFNGASIGMDNALLKIKYGTNTAFGIASNAINANFAMGASKIYPQVTNNYDLGDSTHTWKDLYLNDGIIFNSNGTKVVASASGHIMLYANSANPTVQITDTRCYFRKDLRAYNDGSQNVGSDTERFGTGFFKNGISDGTNSATIADLAALITYAKAQGWIS